MTRIYSRPNSCFASISLILVLSISTVANATSYAHDSKPNFNLIQQDSTIMITPPPSQEQQQQPLLSDILAKLQQTQIFASLVRDVDSATSLLSSEVSSSSNSGDASSSQRVIVFAPSNAALHALPQKPWRSARDADQFGTRAYEGAAGAQRASSNLQQFVQRQIVVLGQEWREGERVKTVGGKQVWWDRDADGSGRRILNPGNIKVESEEKAGNGDIWVVQGVLGEG